MAFSRFVGSLVLAGMMLGGCAKPPAQYHASDSPIDTSAVTGSIAPVAATLARQDLPERIFNAGALSGRTLHVGSSADIILQPGEVVLTFDDGPRGGKLTRFSRLSTTTTSRRRS